MGSLHGASGKAYSEQEGVTESDDSTTSLQGPLLLLRISDTTSCMLMCICMSAHLPSSDDQCVPSKSARPLMRNRDELLLLHAGNGWF